jgi:Leucine-rich repeat (LRR) protein
VSLPKLQSLHISHNELLDADILQPGVDYQIEEISLEGNKLNSWLTVEALGNLKRLSKSFENKGA